MLYGLQNASATNTDPEVYPNPAQAVIHMNVPDRTINSAAFTISNAAGKMVKKGVWNQSDAGINISGLPAGVYFIYLNNNGNILYSRFTKQ